jgi:hypothetical protein
MTTPTITSSKDVRDRLVEALSLDLIGPSNESSLAREILPSPPSSWYMTGFLAPSGTEDSTAGDDDDDLDSNRVSEDPTEDAPQERVRRRNGNFPSSMGLSFLVPETTSSIAITIEWGEYVMGPAPDNVNLSVAQNDDSSVDEIVDVVWTRRPESRELDMPIKLGQQNILLPNTMAIRIAATIEVTPKAWQDAGHIPKGTKSVSIFLVNGNHPGDGHNLDRNFIFQAAIKVTCDEGFVDRPNLRGLNEDDPDERIADLQYAHVKDYAVGHGIATDAEIRNGQCHVISTNWMPRANVEKVEARQMPTVLLSMEDLGTMSSSTDVIKGLLPIVSEYRDWIETTGKNLPSNEYRRETASELIRNATLAAERIEQGIKLLQEPLVFRAFQIANRAMAAAARQRFSFGSKKKPNELAAPEWRPFQLAFLLLNIEGIWNPASQDRKIVDLLFFPTGGGKTEAYLGLSAFSIVLRRLKDPSLKSAGTCVLMRYTLRLLTLDQLGRAAGLICALELERIKAKDVLGEWPFEIGLWVGRGTTPNRIGGRGDNDDKSAYKMTMQFKDDPRTKPSPIPISNCPWCDAEITKDSFHLYPDLNRPLSLIVRCVSRDCDFSSSKGMNLPIIAVDEHIYRRLPCFLIATVDKFASLPWVGESGAILGHVNRYDADGFYRSDLTNKGQMLGVSKLPGPDLIIQDELHLISGPLGTITGLFEAAVDELSARIDESGTKISPKIIASTATVRRAKEQINALFNRKTVDLFPPPGPDIRDSFFAQTISADKKNPRQYIGIAAQGRSQKVTLLRTYVALLSAAQKLYEDCAPAEKSKVNPADPYMTVLGYFNSLRELGGSRRIVEDEVRSQLLKRSNRMRLNQTERYLANRKISDEPVELTSRLSTAKVAAAKADLAKIFTSKDRVDVALATNMISVGLDITRLGLMAVLGQPKTSSEYIQTTSRVGRVDERPGLVVCLYNIHKHRDRSHYERFANYHECFYRSVEATSVTPFAPRALDKALAATFVTIVRHSIGAMTPENGAFNILNVAELLPAAVQAIAERAADYQPVPEEDAAAIRRNLTDRLGSLTDKWKRIARDVQSTGARLEYAGGKGAQAPNLLHDFLDPELNNLPSDYHDFRANRSMRDVEAQVGLLLTDLTGRELEVKND